jgi:hypothetical protein
MSSEWDVASEPQPSHDCDHQFMCWRCGERPQVAAGERLGRLVGALVGLVLLGIVVTPLVWLLRVCWSWAL